MNENFWNGFEKEAMSLAPVKNIARKAGNKAKEVAAKIPGMKGKVVPGGLYANTAQAPMKNPLRNQGAVQAAKTPQTYVQQQPRFVTVDNLPGGNRAPAKNPLMRGQTKGQAQAKAQAAAAVQPAAAAAHAAPAPAPKPAANAAKDSSKPSLWDKARAAPRRTLALGAAGTVGVGYAMSGPSQQQQPQYYGGGY